MNNSSTVSDRNAVDPKAYWRAVRQMEKKYAYRIGTLTIRWNRIHYSLIALCSQVPPGPAHKELQRLGAIPNNERVRGELRRIVLAARPFDEDLRESLLWVFDQLGILEQLRNGFMHHTLAFAGAASRVIVDPLMAMDRYHEVKGDPDLAYRVMKADVDMLHAYSVASFSHFIDSTITPPPERPKLKVMSTFPKLTMR